MSRGKKTNRGAPPTGKEIEHPPSGSAKTNRNAQPELIEAIRADQASNVDINVLLVSITNTIDDPEQMLEASERVMELANRFGCSSSATT